MKVATGKFLKLALLGFCIAAMSALSFGQALNSGAQPIALNATLGESLTLNLSGAAVNFALTGGSAANPAAQPSPRPQRGS